MKLLDVFRFHSNEYRFIILESILITIFSYLFTYYVHDVRLTISSCLGAFIVISAVLYIFVFCRDILMLFVEKINDKGYTKIAVAFAIISYALPPLLLFGLFLIFKHP